MQTLVIASQKGGSGKTTLSGHLAVEAELAGAGPVAMIDTDPQGSLAEWWNARKAATPVFVKVGALELEDVLSKLQAAGVRLAIVDTPPAIVGMIAKVIACADLVIIPTRPSPHDLRSIGATVHMVEQACKPLIFVVNDATVRARITGETAVALSQHGTVAPVTIHHRVNFAASMIDGRTVGEVVAQSKSSQEIKSLWTYVADRLQRVQGETAFAARSGGLKLSGVCASLVPDDWNEEQPSENPCDPVIASVESAPLKPTEARREEPYSGPEMCNEAERRSPHGANATFDGAKRRTSVSFGKR